MGRRWRLALQRTHDHLFDPCIAELAWLSGTRLIEQAIQSLFLKPAPPFTYGLNAGLCFMGDSGSGQSFGSAQYDPRSHRQSLGGLPSPRPSLQGQALLL